MPTKAWVRASRPRSLLRTMSPAGSSRWRHALYPAPRPSAKSPRPWLPARPSPHPPIAVSAVIRWACRRAFALSSKLTRRRGRALCSQGKRRPHQVDRSRRPWRLPRHRHAGRFVDTPNVRVRGPTVRRTAYTMGKNFESLLPGCKSMRLRLVVFLLMLLASPFAWASMPLNAKVCPRSRPCWRR